MPLYHFCFCWQSDGWLEGLWRNEQVHGCFFQAIPLQDFFGAEMHQKLCPFFSTPQKVDEMFLFVAVFKRWKKAKGKGAASHERCSKQLEQLGGPPKSQPWIIYLHIYYKLCKRSDPLRSGPFLAILLEIWFSIMDIVSSIGVMQQWIFQTKSPQRLAIFNY